MIKQIDWLIVGAGPAGLQFAYYCEKNNIDYLILEKSNTVGSFFEKFPRHDQLISINKVYTGFDDDKLNLRWDWNSLLSDDDSALFKEFSDEYFPEREVLLKYLNHYAQKFQLKIRFHQTVASIEKDESFKVMTAEGEVYQCNKLFIATGIGLPYIPEIPGIELTTNYVNMSVNLDDYKNKRVLFIGKGNSALESANHLLGVTSLIHIASPNPPKMAWRSHYVGHIRAINNHFLETYQLKSQNAVVNASIDKIEKCNDKFEVTFNYSMASGEVESISYDYVIACTGFKFDASIFSESCKPELAINDRFPNLDSSYESTNTKDLYFIGAQMHMRDFKKKQSGFIHGFRYNISFLFKRLWAEKKGMSYPHLELELDSKLAARHIIDRVNITSSLWQQTGYLCDVLECDLALQKFKYTAGIPVDFALDGKLSQNKHLFLVTLEFGQERIDQYQNVFGIDRIHKDDFARALLSTGIHPIVRHYCDGQLVSEHHVIEDFDSVWVESVHIEPLITYLQQEIKAISNQAVVGQTA